MQEIHLLSEIYNLLHIKIATIEGKNINKCQVVFLSSSSSSFLGRVTKAIIQIQLKVSGLCKVIFFFFLMLPCPQSLINFVQKYLAFSSFHIDFLQSTYSLLHVGISLFFNMQLAFNFSIVQNSTHQKKLDCCCPSITFCEHTCQIVI